MVFVSKKQRQNLINFLNDANLHTFFYFLKKSLVYYNILTFNSLMIKFGKSEAFIRGRLKLVNLIMEFRNMLEKDAINIGVAGVLACYPNDLQNKIYIEHFDENCLGWQSWINYKASRAQCAIEDTYSTTWRKQSGTHLSGCS